MRVSPGIVFHRTHIPRDACFPAHIPLTSYVLQVIVIRVSPGIMFPHHPTRTLRTFTAYGSLAIYVATICMHAYVARSNTVTKEPSSG